MSLLYNYLPPRILVQSRARGCAVLTLQQIILDVLNKSEKIQHLTYSMNSVCHHTHTHTLSLSLYLCPHGAHTHTEERSHYSQLEDLLSIPDSLVNWRISCILGSSEVRSSFPV
jgi:hypothetical protein